MKFWLFAMFHFVFKVGLW